jgi:hypothetical protein
MPQVLLLNAPTRLWWCASVDLGFVNGKRRRKVIYGETRKEVADKLKALHRDQATGINIAPEQQTIQGLLGNLAGAASQAP